MFSIDCGLPLDFSRHPPERLCISLTLDAGGKGEVDFQMILPPIIELKRRGNEGLHYDRY